MHLMFRSTAMFRACVSKLYCTLLVNTVHCSHPLHPRLTNQCQWFVAKLDSYPLFIRFILVLALLVGVFLLGTM